MDFLKLVWRTSTNTNALRIASGNYEIYFFESLYRVLYIVGLSFCEKGRKYHIYSLTVKTLLLLLICAELWAFFTVAGTIDRIIESINVTTIQYGAIYKYLTMKNNRETFRSLASAMESPNFDLSTNQRKKIMEIWQKRNEDSLMLLLGLGTCTVLVWHTYPLLDDFEYNLMVMIRLPYSYETPLRYTFTYIGIAILFSYISYFVMTNDLVLQAHVMNLLCQYAVLNDCLRNILIECEKDFKAVDLKNIHKNENFRKLYNKRLGSLVEQHQLILNNTLKLRDILSAPMLTQLAISTILICSIGFQIATSATENRTKWLMSLLYLGYNMFVLFIICRWCEEIKVQSAKIGDAVYCSGWENGVATMPGVRLRLLLILARANKPVSLYAGGMYDLSLEAFANIVKTSYSALTVLLRLR